MYDDFYKSQLSSQARQYYELILRRCRMGDVKCSFELPVRPSYRKVSIGESFEAIKAIREDHPEFFWIGNEYSATLRGKKLTLDCKAIYTAEQIRRIKKLLERYLVAIVAGTDGMSVLVKERMIYERIAMIDYKNNNEVHDHNVVSALLKGTSVCEGYTSLLILALRRVGIPAIKVSGYANEKHCWAIAWINGTPVHLDVTWDNVKNGRPRYRYFNLTDDEITRDHRIDTIGVPKCTNSNYSGRLMKKGVLNKLEHAFPRFASALVV